MAVPLVGTESSLFLRWGREIAGINESALLEGTTSNTRATKIASSFQLSNQDVIDGLYSQLTSQNSANSGWITYLQQTAGNTLIQMYLDDTPPITSADTTTALTALIKQMKAQSQTIQSPTLSSTVTAGSANVGDGECVFSYVDATDGTQNDYVMAETLTASCTNDAYTGGSATSGQEPWSVLGQIAAASNLSWDWPQGSGANTTIATTDPSVSGIIVNGSFDNWSVITDPPSSWTVQTGTVGTSIVRSGTSYTGSYAATFVGDGAELTALRQVIDLEPNTVYHFGVWLRSSGAVAAGVFNVRLLNAASGAVVSDNASTAISLTRTVTTLTTSYEFYSGSILTPAVLPAYTAIELRLSTAMTAAAVLYIDDFGIIEATRLYTGGPYASIWRGATPFATNDSFAIAVTNSGTTSTFARSSDRLFSLKDLGLKIPSGSSPTIADSLIQ
jgi:hypothetical protein